jgi:putative peptidoglycan lipid II flippase
MRLALFVAIPCSVALAVLGEPIVTTLFVRGQFDAVAAHETARSLAWQGGAIWTVAAVRQVIPVYYALGDTRTPVIVSAIDLVAFVVLAILLRGPMGHAGISAAVAGSSFVQMALLLVFLRRRLGTLMVGEVGGSAVRTLLASLAGAAAGWGASRATFGPRWLPGLLATAAFGLAFVIVAAAVRSPELASIAGGVKRRLARTRGGS